MPLLIIAGIPQGVVRRNKGFRLSFPGWTIRFEHARSHGPDLRTCWDQVLATADASSEDGTHILAYHQPESERPGFARDVNSRHRLVWHSKEEVGLYGSDTYADLVSRIIGFELDWRERVRPQNTASPLILPEPTFTPKRGLEQLWERARALTMNHDRLDHVQTLAREFRNKHYRNGVWRDRRELIFSVGTGHGRAERRNRWKFTMLVPESFHYDVKHSRGTGVVIRDANLQTHRFHRYTNVDCHGYCRGGH